MHSATQSGDSSTKPQTRLSLSAAWCRGATAGFILIICFLASAAVQALAGADFLIVRITAGIAGIGGLLGAGAVFLACLSFSHRKWARALYVFLPVAVFVTLAAYAVVTLDYPWESALLRTARIFGCPLVALGLVWAVVERLKAPSTSIASAALGGLLVGCALLTYL